MAPTPSLRRLWKMYRELLAQDRMSRRDPVLAHAAFYSGARCVFKVLDYHLERGDVEEVQRVICQQGRMLRRLQGQPARKRRH